MGVTWTGERAGGMGGVWRIQLLDGLGAESQERTRPPFGFLNANRRLACLAYDGERTHPRERLMEQLWPARGAAARRASAWNWPGLFIPLSPAGRAPLLDGDLSERRQRLDPHHVRKRLS